MLQGCSITAASQGGGRGGIESGYCLEGTRRELGKRVTKSSYKCPLRLLYPVLEEAKISLETCQPRASAGVDPSEVFVIAFFP